MSIVPRLGKYESSNVLIKFSKALPDINCFAKRDGALPFLTDSVILVSSNTALNKYSFAISSPRSILPTKPLFSI